MIMDMLPRDLSAALAAMDDDGPTPSLNDPKRQYPPTNKIDCPLLNVLLPRKEFGFVLEFCTFPDLHMLFMVGEQSKLPYLRHTCRAELLRLIEALIHASIGIIWTLCTPC